MPPSTPRRKRHRIPGPHIDLSLPVYLPSRRHGSDEPFLWIVFKVGSTLAVLWGGLYLMVSYRSILQEQQQQQEQGHALQVKNGYIIPLSQRNHYVQNGDHLSKIETAPFMIASGGNNNNNMDAFSIAQEYDLHVGASVLKGLKQKKRDDESAVAFVPESERLRNEFSLAFGNESLARMIYHQALTGQVEGIAQRLLEIRQGDPSRRQVSVLVVGSSVAMGYGNFYNQSYSHVLESRMKRTFQGLGLQLTVQNLAMSDLTEFPFAWCLGNHYYPKDGGPDIVVWDFGDSPPARLEAFLRTMFALWQTPQRPLFFIFRALSHEQGRVIEYYRNAGVLIHPVVIQDEFAYQPFLRLDEKLRPPAFQSYQDFGAPGGSPGKVHPHLSLRQHEFVSWVLSLHLLTALELLVVAAGNSATSIPYSLVTITDQLPEPLLLHSERRSSWGALLLGTVDKSRLNCHTTFDFVPRDPEMDPIENLPGIPHNFHQLVVNGTIGKEFELLLPKTAMWYKHGWVLDLDLDAKRTKLVSRTHAFLGFPDFKQAFYGVTYSGPMRLFLPVGDDADLVGRPAQDFLAVVLVCESDAPQYQGSCTLRSDVQFRVGSYPTRIQSVDSEVVATFEKRTCVEVKIPLGAKLSSRQVVSTGTSRVGMELEVEVTNQRVTWKQGPCSVAHVIWIANEYVISG